MYNNLGCIQIIVHLWGDDTIKTSKIREKQADAAHGESRKADEIKQQVARVSETGEFSKRDPVWQLNEEFRQTFDLTGQKRAEEQEDAYKGESVLKTDSGKENHQNTDFSDKYMPREGNPEEPELKKFSETAFQRGGLSSAVINGTGKSMFFSCLNRSVDTPDVKMMRERMLFQQSSKHRNIPGTARGRIVTNPGYAQSAVGIVVDSIRDARYTMKYMQDVAEGKMGPDGMATMRKQYPFLTDDREKELLQKYKNQLGAAASNAQKNALNAGILKLEHVIEKKAQMKKQFLEQLRKLQDNARRAEKMFMSEDFLSELQTESEKTSTEDIPPDNNDETDENSDFGEETEEWRRNPKAAVKA